MRLLIIRHAKAEDREAFAKSGHADELRPLAVDGRKRMRQAAEGLAVLVPKVDAVATSPLVRAVETAQIVAKGWKADVEELPALSPGESRGEVLKWVRRHQRSDGVAVVVGHEPDLKRLVGWLLTGKGTSIVSMKKGAACLIAFDTVAPGGGRLEWMLTSRLLRKIK